MRDNILILFLLMGIAGVINVTGNAITFSNTGIYSINSNIAAANNTLTSTTGGAGILQTQNSEPGLVKNTSFFCNNTIRGGDIGMQLDSWSDYIKLTNISGSNIGIKLMDNVDGYLDWSSIKLCGQQGLLLQPVTSSNLARINAQGTYNIFELNNKTAAGAGSSQTGQIEIDNGGRLKIRSLNNLVRRSGFTPNDNFIFASPGVTIGYGFSGEDVVDGNYWADNSTGVAPPFNKVTPSDPGPDANMSGVTYSNGNSDILQTEYYSTTGVYCGSGVPNQVTHKGNPLPLSIQADSSYDHCSEIVHEGDALRENGTYQAAYDKYRSFFDTCAYLPVAWEVFTSVGSTNASRSTDVHRFEEYREWLKTVLYLNLDTNYYCADVNEILSTFTWFNDIRGRDMRGALAIGYFLVQTNRCPKATAYYDTVAIPATWKALYQAWLDSAQHPTLTPFDSTLPTLEDLGLGILRGKPADVKKFIDATHGEIVSGIMALENPFTTETKIDFSCREAVAIRFEVFDLLGKKVYDGGNRVYDQGPNQIVLPGAGLPHGELFARFSASDGTVKTIKLQHY